MKTNAILHSDIFLWATSILSFAADSITLVTFISQGNFGAMSAPPSPTIPRIEFDTFAVEWRDITLVLLVYVGMAFGIILLHEYHWGGFLGMPTVYTVFLSQLFVGLAILWLMLFSPIGDRQLFVHVAGAWLLGLLLPVAMLTFRSSDDGSSFRIPLILLVVTSPLWALVEIGINRLSWEMAIGTVLIWGLAGIIGSIAIWLVVRKLITGIGRLIYGKRF